MLRILDIRDRNSLQDNIDALTSEMNTHFDAVETKHNTDIINLTNKHNTEITNLTTTHNQDKLELLKNINEEIARATKAEDDLDDRIDALIVTHNNDKDTLHNVISNETTRAEQAESALGSRIDALSVTHNKDKLDLSTEIYNETTRATTAENGLSERIATMEAFFKEADIDASKEFIDTLKEIQEYIASDKTGAAAMTASIQSNATAIETEQARAEAAEAKAFTDAKAYTDQLANEQVATNTSAITTLQTSKVDKVEGQVLTDNNLTNDLKIQYDAAYVHSTSEHAPVDAEKNVQSDWSATDNTSATYILNKPTLGILAEKDTVEKTDLSEEVQTLLNQTITMQVADGYLQYSNDNGVTWTNLIALSELTTEIV